MRKTLARLRRTGELSCCTGDTIVACHALREGVAHAWLVDPLARSLGVMSLEAGRWTPLDRYEGEAKVRVPPFDAIELELRALRI
jgi:hypothetical protein